MKKVVRIIGRMNGGGPARQVAYLHHALRSSFETILVVGAIEQGEQDMRYLLEDSIGVIEIPSMSRSVKGRSDLVSLIKITQLLLREKPDIVHTHTAKAGVLGRLAAIIAGVPIRVHTYHGNVFQSYFGRRASSLIIAIEGMLNRFTTRVIAISESQAQELVEQFKVARRDQVAIVRNGFDLNGLASCGQLREGARHNMHLNADDFLVVWAGRLVTIKNVPLLLDVVRHAAAFPKVKFLVVGDGPLRDEIETLATSCKDLQFIGWQRDMKPIWAAADVVLLTSRNEGTPATLIEAMAAGKPFISTVVGGVPDLAKGPVTGISSDCKRAANGFLTPFSPEAIVGCIAEMMDSPELAKRMGEEGRAFALANYDQNRLASELTELYEKLLEQEETPKGVKTLASPV